MNKTTINLPEKDAERIQRARLVKTMRKLMGLKAQVIAKKLGVLQSNYSKMERGRETLSDERFEIIRSMYIAWREEEVKRLRAHIDQLNSIR